MRVAFYAPMKPPHHPSPSGDRRMAGLLMAALRAAGHAVETASAFRSYDGAGDSVRQRRLGAVGARLAARLVRRYGARTSAERPDAWFTYHLYHKAPDWLGPEVADALGIPYLVAEASHAPKQRDGPWALGHAQAARAIARADLVFGLNPADGPCMLPLLSLPGRLVPLRPFLDARPYAAAADGRRCHRAAIAASLGIDASTPWLLSVAMMRQGDKLASYRVLGEALARLEKRPWRLLVAGDGPARPDVKAALAGVARRVHWLGEREASTLPAIYAASDLYVWPAVNEAYGVAFLEAAAAGLPAVAGASGGVPEIVADGTTGLLVPAGNAGAFAEAAGRLLDRPGWRRALGRAARRIAATEHGLDGAARSLDSALTEIGR